MKKRILFILILLLLFSALFSGCGQAETVSLKEKIIASVVSDASGYEEVSLNGEYSAFNNGSVKAVYKKDNSYIIYSIGKYGYNGDVEIVTHILNGKIINVKGINIKETEGYGTRAFADSYLNQFKDINISDFEGFKGGSKPQEGIDVIYVTHATRTSTAVLSAVNAAVYYYKNIF